MAKLKKELISKISKTNWDRQTISNNNFDIFVKCIKENIPVDTSICF